MRPHISDDCYWVDDTGTARHGTVAHTFVFGGTPFYVMLEATSTDFVGPPLREDQFEVSALGFGYAALDDGDRSASDK